LLGFATSLAYTGAISTSQPLVGALIFPVVLVIIILLGLELVTGSFGLLPLMVAERGATPRAVVVNWIWVFAGNLLGSVLYGVLLAVTLNMAGTADLSALGEHIIAAAEAKTNTYEAAGAAGMLTSFVKAILCNWMVCLSVVLAMSSTSTIGKIFCAWMPVFIFFAQGFEHAVVNMFVIPTGMMIGADVSFGDWWVWNQIPVTLGNIIGGAIFCCGALYFTYRPRKDAAAVHPHRMPAE
jgi:formate/nitrite transporter